jgi:hypothetical protein
MASSGMSSLSMTPRDSDYAQHHLNATADAEPREDAAKISSDRGFTQTQRQGDLPIALTLHQSFDYFRVLTAKTEVAHDVLPGAPVEG